MSEPQTHCPFVGLGADRTLLRNAPDAAHRCYALQPPGAPDVYYQKSFCLATGHIKCPFFQSPQTLSDAAAGRGASGAMPAAGSAEGIRRWLPLAVWAAVGLLACVVAFVYLRDAGLFGRSQPPPLAAASRAHVDADCPDGECVRRRNCRRNTSRRAAHANHPGRAHP